VLIKGKTVLLRAPEATDLELLNRWANDPGIWRHLTGWHFPYSTRSTAEWIASRQASDQRDQVFCIDVPGVGLVGTSSLHEIDWKNRRALQGMMIGDERNRGKGYAVDAQMALLRYVFDELGLQRLHSEIIDSNERSIRFYQKCGWTVDGRQAEFYFREGQWHGRVLIGITRQGYQDHCAKTGYWGGAGRPARSTSAPARKAAPGRSRKARKGGK
jgi:RimJ/RimL family protein N-acetyltransferase